MEPLSYPLFFTRGELGWGRDGQEDPERDVLSFYKYLTSRLLMPEPYDNIYGHCEEGTQGLLTMPSAKDPSIFIPCNRFQVLARLGK
jgi:hypothetical protein